MPETLFDWFRDVAVAVLLAIAACLLIRGNKRRKPMEDTEWILNELRRQEQNHKR